jgi:signal peptidase I
MARLLVMSSVDDRFPTQAVPLSSLPEEGDDSVKITRRHAAARGLAWELLQTILLTLVIFVAVRSVVQNFRVEGASMEPTLQTGQYLLINRAAYYHLEGTPFDGLIPTTSQGSLRFLFGGPQRGDIAVFRAPMQPDKDYIKRIIGLPGDTVLIRNGEVYVNGQLLDEPYIHFFASYNYPITGNPVTVRDGQYFVLGDNRPNSSDSHLGWFVPVENLVGRSWLSYWPPSTWGVTPHAAYAQ